MRWLLLVLILGVSHWCVGQKDSTTTIAKTTTTKTKTTETDTLARPTQRNPKRAALMSAVAPGLGQIYNKRYWKLPIVYGALGATGYFVVSNRVFFNQFKSAYAEHAALIESTGDNTLLYDNRYRLADLQSLAEAYQTQMEYAGIAFLAFYMMQIVDAAVDAHLYYFDVSEDLSLHWNPSVQTTAMTNPTTSLSLTLKF